MKALILTAPQKMEIVEVKKPAINHNDVLLKVDTVGICGSDLKGYSHRIDDILGHEIAGIVDEIGPGVTHLQAGDRAVVLPLVTCGSCQYCITGMIQLCINIVHIGGQVPGGFAEYVKVPARNIFKIPTDMPFETAVLTEPLACSLRAAHRALASNPFANTLIFGAGAIGMLAAKVVQILGSSQVVIADTNPFRLETVSQIGLKALFNSADSKFRQELEAISGGRGIDVVIDAAGVQSTREAAVQLLNPGGVLMNIGLGQNETVLPLKAMIHHELDMKQSFCYTAKDFTDALQLLADKKISESGWTTMRSLDQGDNSFKELLSGQCGFGKIMLKP